MRRRHIRRARGRRKSISVSVGNAVAATDYEPTVEERYQSLCEILLRYTSRITVVSMLTVVCRNHDIAQPPQSLAHLERLVEALSHGIRTFCPAHDVPRLMLSIAEILE